MNENSMMQPVWVVYDLAPAHHEGAIRDKLIEMGWTPPSAEPAQPVEAVDEDTREFALRAMALNYTDRHCWDHLDADACRRGADEIKALRVALAHPRPTGDGMVSVVAEDANNYCRILTALGMEEEGDPVAEVERLIAEAYEQGNKDAGVTLSAPTVEQAGEVVGFTSEDVCNLHSLCGVLENLSKKRAPDPRDLDAEYFVTANINHAVKSATYWLPVVKGIYMRLYGALAEKARSADNEDAQPRTLGVPDGWKIVPCAGGAP